MLNITRRHRIEARRAVAAARDQLSRLPLIPGMAVRVDHRHDRALGYLVTVAAWWDHPATGVRTAARHTVSAAAGPIAAEQAAERVVRELTAHLRPVRVVTGPAVHVPAPPAPPAMQSAVATPAATTGMVHITPLHPTGVSTIAADEATRARLRAALEQTAATYRRGDFA